MMMLINNAFNRRFCLLVLCMVFLGCGEKTPTQKSSAPVEKVPTATEDTKQETKVSICPQGPFEPFPQGELVAKFAAGIAPEDKEVHLFEGPVWLDGALYFSDFKPVEGFPSEIMKFVPEKEGAYTVAVPDSGSNGLALDSTRTKLLAATHKTHSVSMVDLQTGEATPIVQGYDSKEFNSPNDLTMRSDGNLYFTDPDFQADKPRPQGKTSVYRVTPDRRVEVVDDTIENPNGISLSPDETILYVAGNLEKGFVKRYKVTKDGSVGTGEIFVDGITVPDGMAIDCAGNVYVTEHTEKQIRIFSPKGEPLGRIGGLERNVTNAAFGGAEQKTLYITTLGWLYQIEMPIPGLPY